MTTTDFELLANAPRGFADLLAAELRALDAVDVRERPLGVSFRGDARVAYRACLESRIASRVFLVVARFQAGSADDIYRHLRETPWQQHLSARGTLACEWSGRHPAITNTHYGALRLKDAICDGLRDATGARPDIALARPSVRVHAHAFRNEVTVSLDLSGEGLHRRGYRAHAGEAPLRENVAAGMLVRAGWPELAARGAPFLDPMCGSGTLAIEAAWIALDRAPGLLRDYYGFFGWAAHDATVWNAVRAAALARVKSEDRLPSVLCAADRDAGMIRMASENAKLAQVGTCIEFAQRNLEDAMPPDTSSVTGGLLCTNPPYGARLEDVERSRAVHRELGTVLRDRFSGWDAAVLTGAPELGLEMGLRAHRAHVVWNGAIECRLLRFRIEADAERDFLPKRTPLVDPALRDAPGARMFANRLAKNAKRLGAWAKKNAITCYRVYDADMPEYAFAVDLYRSADGDERWAYVQEYAAPATIAVEDAHRRRREALSVLPEVLDLAEDHVHVRTRRKTGRSDQYVKEAEQRRFHVIEEAGLRFRVNFTDYLDTGLFLDHRLTRQRLHASAARKRFLNLFGYTGSATVHAAAGRARATTTVDLSHTYLDWGRDNLAINGLSGAQHQFIQADCREWLLEAHRLEHRYDLIFLDPPTFSNSKRMQGVHDIQRDHASLIDACMRILAPGGELVFSTNAQKFRLDPELSLRHAVRDISRETLPEDFARNPRIHTCFVVAERP